MVNFCKGCNEEHDDFAWKFTEVEFENEKGEVEKVSGWFCRKWVTIGGGKTVKEWQEQIATPLWKIAGFKPTAKELHEEKVRKAKGFSHYEMQRERYKNMPRLPGGDKLKKDVLSGNLKQDDTPLKFKKGKPK